MTRAEGELPYAEPFEARVVSRYDDIVQAPRRLARHKPWIREQAHRLIDGANVLSTCREGTCGTCGVRVLDGIPEHRDSVLSLEERLANKPA